MVIDIMMKMSSLMLKIWQPLLLFCLIFSVGVTRAMTVDGEFKGDVFRWVSAQTSLPGFVAPSIWEPINGLVPADSFIPGAGTTSIVTFNLLGAVSVPVRLNLKGVEYISPEFHHCEADSQGNAPATCESSGIIRVMTPGLSEQKVVLTREITPFTHVRPIFSLTGSGGQTLEDAFENASAPAGVYFAQVSIPMSYDYFRMGVRVRHNWSLNVAIKINYAPAILTSVVLTSPTAGVMATNYYIGFDGQQKAQGSALFNGVASGTFTNGLHVVLKAGDDYHLREVTSSAVPKVIPYSVNCAGCSSSALVINGVAQPDMLVTGVTIPGVNVSTINFSINVNFSDVDLSTLRTGTYQGHFSLLFEPNI
ncbi:TPA: hypothetical protein ACSPZY_004362 [Aeromonas veronii]